MSLRKLFLMAAFAVGFASPAICQTQCPDDAAYSVRGAIKEIGTTKDGKTYYEINDKNCGWGEDEKTRDNDTIAVYPEKVTGVCNVGKMASVSGFRHSECDAAFGVCIVHLNNATVICDASPQHASSADASRFNRLYDAWHLESEGIRFSSNTHDYVSLPSFQKIVGLGPGAIPLLREKLIQDGDGDFMLAEAVAAICGWNRADFTGENEQAFRDQVLQRLRSEAR